MLKAYINDKNKIKGGIFTNMGSSAIFPSGGMSSHNYQ